MRAQVDALARARDGRSERVEQAGVIADQREHRPVVILVGVHVEQASRAGKGCGEGVDRCPVPSLREVRYRLQGQLHAPYSRRVRAYYEARAREYDEWYEGLGRFDGLDRPHWNEEVRELERVVASLPPARTLDVACGTGFLTRQLRGEIVGLDQSESMLAIAAERVPDGEFVRGDALELPFEDGSFERLFTGHFYGHLGDGDRERFLSEARRVAPELVVVDSAVRPDREEEERQERVLNDGSRWDVYKRYFTGEGLARELGGCEVLHDGRWFVVVCAR
jgi:SAM-dependent methyltransferase